MKQTQRWYGWNILGVSAVAHIATSPGQTYLVSLFNVPMRESLGLSASAISTAYLFATLISATALTTIGRMSDRAGPGRAMALAAAGMAIASMAMGSVRGFASLCVGFCLLRLSAQGALGLASGHALALWFEKRLGRAEGIRLTLFGFAMVVLPPLVSRLVSGVGWRWAWPVLGCCAAATVAVALLFHRDRPEDVGSHLDGDPSVDNDTQASPDAGATLHQAFRSPIWWTVAASSANSGMIGTALLFHAQPIASEQGLGLAEAATLISTFAIGSTASYLASGWISDRVNAFVIYAFSGAAYAGLCIALAWLPTPQGAFWGFALLGIVTATLMTTNAPTLARVFGRAHHGAIRGAVGTASVAGTALGPFVAGLSLDLTGSFAWGFAFFAAASSSVAALAGWTRASASAVRLAVRTTEAPR